MADLPNVFEKHIHIHHCVQLKLFSKNGLLKQSVVCYCNNNNNYNNNNTNNSRIMAKQVEENVNQGVTLFLKNRNNFFFFSQLRVMFKNN